MGMGMPMGGPLSYMGGFHPMMMSSPYGPPGGQFGGYSPWANFGLMMAPDRSPLGMMAAQRPRPSFAGPMGAYAVTPEMIGQSRAQPSQPRRPQGMGRMAAQTYGWG
jgi:hypothetical protein